MTNSNALTASNIRYLLTMKELDGDGRGVRCIALATALGLSKPSVHNMMGTFSQMGLISRDSYGAAFFTDEGNGRLNMAIVEFKNASRACMSGNHELKALKGAE